MVCVVCMVCMVCSMYGRYGMYGRFGRFGRYGRYGMVRLVGMVFTVEGRLEVKLPTIWTDEKHVGRVRERRRVEERRSEKRKSQKKEGAGARKGRKVGKAAGAEPSGQMRNEKKLPGTDHFWKLRCRKSACRCGAKQISKSKFTQHHMFAPLLGLQMSLRVAGARDCGPCQN